MRLWNVTNSTSPLSCVRMFVFVSVSMIRFQRLSLRSSKWYVAIPHLYAPTKFMIPKKIILAVALPPEMVSKFFENDFSLIRVS